MTDAELLDEQIKRVTIGLASRIQALVIYGLTGIGIGLLMIATGGPSAIEDISGPVARIIFGTPVLIAGILTLLGSVNHATTLRAWWSAMIGTSLFCAWATAVAVMLIVAAAHEGVTVGPPWNAIPYHNVRPYAVVLFEGYSALLLLHAITLARLGKPATVE